MSILSQLNVQFSSYRDHFDFWKRYYDSIEGDFQFRQYQLAPKPRTGLDTYSAEIDLQASTWINKVADQNEMAVFTCFSAAWAILLMKHTGCNNPTIQIPLYPGTHQKLRENYHEFLPLSVKFSEGINVKNLLQQVKTKLNYCYQYQDLPKEAVLEEVAVAPKGNVLLYHPDVHGSVTPKDYHDLTCHCKWRKKKLYIRLEYNDDVFETWFIQNLILQFTQIIKSIEDQERKVLNIDMLGPKESKDIVASFSGEHSLIKTNGNWIPLFFKQQVEKYPNSLAINDKDFKVTYKELDYLSDTIAYLLDAKYRVRKGDFIGIITHRQVVTMTAILGILKAGAAFVPIDSEYPEKRVRHIALETSLNLILTAEQLVFTTTVDHPQVILLQEFMNEISHRIVPKVQVQVSQDDAAYVMFTSGSTGKAKGVVVTHENVTRLVKDTNYVQLTCGDRVLQLSNLSFDGFVFDLFGALLNGASLFIPDKDTVLSNQRLVEFIQSNGINITFITTALFNNLVELSPQCLASFDRIYFGGEDVSVLHVIEALEHNEGALKLIHVYGPTENTTFSTYYPIKQVPPDAVTIPIGKPIAGTTVYILNDKMQVQPPGVNGEIFLGGRGVARGYLNDPRLTESKLVEFYFQGLSPQRLFRTGDIGQWLPDGNIVFVGRKDSQVKIRGYRIEPQETAFVLKKCEGVAQAYVKVISTDNNSKSLAAYYTGKKQPMSFLTQHLRDYLPEYMLPAYIVFLDALPLNANGKVDVKALPRPNFGRSSAPKTDNERMLVEVWEKVLGKKKIGVKDDFFLVGGDSIKGIQIATRVNELGFKLEVRDIFRHLRIDRIAIGLKARTQSIDQRRVIGDVRLSPMQVEFFKKFGPRHHFNQAVLLSFKEALSLEGLKEIFRKIFEHHDAFRMTYTFSGHKVTQYNHILMESDIVFCDHSKNHEDKDQILASINQVHQSIDLMKGPLIKLALLRLSDGDRLLITIHHLVVDGISWRILFEDFGRLYYQYKDGIQLSLPPKTDSYQRWTDKLCEYADSVAIDKERDYWSSILSRSFPSIPSDDNRSTKGIQGNIGTSSFSLSMDETELLLNKVNLPYGTQINDILIAALGKSLQQTYNFSEITLALEGHGREELFEDVNISRTIGWFTSVFPISLPLHHATNLHTYIREVKETIRKVPKNGIGYGILKNLSAKGIDDSEVESDIQIAFNYLGQFDSDLASSDLVVAEESTGTTQSPEIHRLYELEYLGILVDGCLKISLQYDTNQFRFETIKALQDNYKQSLLEIINHCTSCPHKTLTPSDLSYKELSMQYLDHLSEKYAIEDIYPLTPMQEGMLFHSLLEPDSPVYFMQFSYCFSGSFNVEAIRKALAALIERHDVLRTIFVYYYDLRPLQLVLKNQEPVFSFTDLSAIVNKEEKQELIKSYREKEKKQGFSLDKGPLMRVAVFQHGDNSYEFIWNFHHILIDGWSIGLLTREFYILYSNFVSGSSYQLLDIRKYRDYILWLESLEKKPGTQYWKKYLEGYSVAAGLPRISKDESSSINRSIVINLGAERSDLLNRLSIKYHATLNTVIQTIWGLVLAKYNNSHDVVFGTVVSGRPPQIEGMEHIVGLFINTIPVRVKFESDTCFNTLLQEIHRLYIEGMPHHYISLAESQTLTPLKQGLINHLLIFENYPIDPVYETGAASQTSEDIREIDVQNFDFFDPNNYGFNVVIGRGNDTPVRFEFNDGIYDEAVINQIATHLIEVLDQVLRNEQICMVDLNFTVSDYKSPNVPISISPQGGTIDEQFGMQVLKTPHASAIVCGPSAITYLQLDNESNIIAEHLIRYGNAGPGKIVGILIGRSIDMITAALAILKIGAAYLPIDPGYPEKRINYILSDADVRILITRAEYHNKVMEFSGKLLLVNALADWQNINCTHNNHHRTANSNELAYVIYTSGSTGLPKGVAVSHGSLSNLCAWHSNTFFVDNRSKATVYAGVGFDASIWEIWPYLLRGACLIVIDDNLLRMNEDRILNLLQTQVITHCFLPTSICEQVIDKNQLPNNLMLLTGGEAWQKPVPAGIKIINNYGPTESTVVATSMNLNHSQYKKHNPIGHPIKDTEVLILNEKSFEVPMAVIGEICVSGAGLALGYLNDVELTAKKFRISKSGGCIYHTGDLGRRLPDGSIEFMGRMDSQVKIRGFRVELSEIEYTLQRLPKIQSALVMLIENTQLWAFYKATHELAEEELRGELRKFLPEYMFPIRYIHLSEFPLTPNGKVDRNSLLKTTAILQDEDSTPLENPVEKSIGEIWKRVLGKKEIRSNQNFFEIGGHSLLATQIVASLHEQFNKKIDLQNLFQYPTIKELAQFIINEAASSNDTLEDVEEQDYYSLSSAQRLVWSWHQMDSTKMSLNISNTLWLTGDLEVACLSKALKDVVSRHESLRTIFPVVDGEPVQKIILLESINLDYELLDDLQCSGEALDQLVMAELKITFDLTNGPLYKIKLFRCQESKRFFFCLSMHHIISDGISMQILFEEVINLYNGYQNGHITTLDPLQFQFRNFVAWQNKKLILGELSASEDYWQSYLENYQKLDIQTDFPRLSTPSYTGDQVEILFDKTFTKEIRMFSRKNNQSIFITLMSALNVVLYRLTGMTDIIIGSPVDGRDLPGLENQVGFYVNMLPLRMVFNESINFSDLMRIVKKNVFSSIEHKFYPLEYIARQNKLVRKSNRSIFFDVGFTWQEIIKEPLTVPSNFTISPYRRKSNTSRYDLWFYGMNGQSNIGLTLEFNTDCFKAESAWRMLKMLKEILWQTMRNEFIKISEIEIMEDQSTDAEKYYFFTDLNLE